MTRDEMLLERAATALRAIDGDGGDQVEDNAYGVGQTRARVVRRVRIRRVVRHATVAMAVIVFAFIGVPSAWALATGHAPAWVAPLLRVLESDASDASAVAPTTARRAFVRPRSIAHDHVAPAPASVIPSSPVVAPVVAARIAPPRVLAPSHAVRVSHHVVVAVPASAPALAPSQTEPTDPDGLYRTAHELHFVTRDAGGALLAWDRYLAASPDGRFAPEARYNRALDLVRLGRLDAARAALGPIARGEHGDYRQQEAAALLEALDAVRMPAPSATP